MTRLVCPARHIESGMVLALETMSVRMHLECLKVFRDAWTPTLFVVRLFVRPSIACPGAVQQPGVRSCCTKMRGIFRISGCKEVQHAGPGQYAVGLLSFGQLVINSLAQDDRLFFTGTGNPHSRDLQSCLNVADVDE